MSPTSKAPLRKRIITGWRQVERRLKEVRTRRFPPVQLKREH